VCAGASSPRYDATPENFAALKTRITDTLAALEAIEAAEVDAFIGRDMRFAFVTPCRLHRRDFLLSFSQPNFYFHAATAYDILRWKRILIGKRDFMGRTRRKK